VAQNRVQSFSFGISRDEPSGSANRVFTHFTDFHLTMVMLKFCVIHHGERGDGIC
jgi:hypothetical protein